LIFYFTNLFTLREIIMKKLIALSIFAMVLTGCNTVAGVGKDVQRAGQAVQGASGH
jgi:predicted small secreted protein